MGALVWPERVLRYVAGTGRDPEVSCPAIERTARVQAVNFFATLPDIRPESVLDIGCGLAVLDVHLVRAYPSLTTVHLMDGDGTEAHASRFQAEGMKPWADVRAGGWLVKANAPDRVSVHAHLADPERTIPVDLVISSRSWGHHYPIPVYAAMVRRCLKPGGFVVVDIRQATDGVVHMQEAGFRTVGRVPDPSVKCRRLVFERGG